MPLGLQLFVESDHTSLTPLIHHPLLGRIQPPSLALLDSNMNDVSVVNLFPCENSIRGIMVLCGGVRHETIDGDKVKCIPVSHTYIHIYI